MANKGLFFLKCGQKWPKNGQKSSANSSIKTAVKGIFTVSRSGRGPGSNRVSAPQRKFCFVGVHPNENFDIARSSGCTPMKNSNFVSLGCTPVKNSNFYLTGVHPSEYFARWGAPQWKFRTPLGQWDRVCTKGYERVREGTKGYERVRNILTSVRRIEGV